MHPFRAQSLDPKKLDWKSYLRICSGGNLAGVERLVGDLDSKALTITLSQKGFCN